MDLCFQNEFSESPKNATCLTNKYISADDGTRTRNPSVINILSVIHIISSKHTTCTVRNHFKAQEIKFGATNSNVVHQGDSLRRNKEKRFCF